MKGARAIVILPALTVAPNAAQQAKSLPSEKRPRDEQPRGAKGMGVGPGDKKDLATFVSEAEARARARLGA
jgi:hypothetical protein